MQPKSIPQVPDHAIFGEYARQANKKMEDGLNRRKFNEIEVADKNQNILLTDDGAIALNPGTYRMNGFSNVTMQDELYPPPLPHGSTYPGYCLVYKKEDENKGKELLELALGIGSPIAAAYFAPSTFDLIATFTAPALICVGHQSGDELYGEVYLSVYEVGGVASEYHVVARIAITKLPV